MTRISTRVAIVAAVVVSLMAGDAMAWGLRAQQSVTAMALQILKEKYPTTLRPQGVTGQDFGEDVLRGSKDGWAVLAPTSPLGSEGEVIQAVGAEIQLLRTVREYGPTSYFAYRMGVLSSLVASGLAPYGFAWSEGDVQLQKQIYSDVEEQIDSYTFKPTKKDMEYIRDVKEYFADRLLFLNDDKKLIADDYARGVGYNGFMKDGGNAYFCRCVEAVADVWDTVLYPAPDAGRKAASPVALTWYFVREIDYLLNVKKNLTWADKSYEHLASVNAGIVEAYEQLGDMYYKFGEDSENLPAMERGVAEWKVAYDKGGPERRRLGEKLAKNYATIGDKYISESEAPGASEDCLPNALNAYQTAFEYNQTDAAIAEKIKDTHKRIADRQQKYELCMELLAKGEKVQAEADNMRVSGDQGNAIRTYEQATTFFEAVPDDFKQQLEKAKDNIRRIEKNITDTVNEVLDRASGAIDEGDKLKDGHKYEEAIASYEKVPTILNVIPDTVKKAQLDDRQEILDIATKKVEDAKVQMVRYREAQEAAARAAQANPGGAARSGGAGAAAPAAAPPAK